MKLTIQVKPNSRIETIETLPNGTLVLKVRAPATEGKANTAVIEALATHFKVPKSRIQIVRGKASRTKVVEIA
ncbi:MAG: DUF167 domain-containing protein [Deltaproteobacteria bacterium]|nr:DUF167 domain-containing protein [Deltaproteobacteria bacterium]MBI3295888.1 DUF167 domain-containing protein [Deltaproteobacteria bacterium]